MGPDPSHSLFIDPSHPISNNGAIFSENIQHQAMLAAAVGNGNHPIHRAGGIADAMAAAAASNHNRVDLLKLAHGVVAASASGGVTSPVGLLPKPVGEGDVEWAYALLDTSRVSTFCIAILLIVYGSFRSLNMEQEARLKEKDKANVETPGVQTMDSTQALFLPIGASLSLLTMFFFFDSLQTVFALCSAVIATVAFAFLLLPMCQYTIKPCSDGRNKISLGFFGRFTAAELLSFCLAFTLVCLWILTGHWLLMDALGMGLCVAFIALVRLPSLKVSTLLLSGLLIYDVFWVFFSSYIFNANVMVRVATRPVDNPVGIVARKLRLGVMRDSPKLSLPGKLVFPSMANSGHFSMLGLGDIVMPGLLLCFVLRYDAHRKSPMADGGGGIGVPGEDGGVRSSGGIHSRVTYFHCSLIGYFLGLLTATVSSEVFKAAQPALLYLVPFTLLPLLVMAYLKGDLRRMWHDPFLPPEKPPKSQIV